MGGILSHEEKALRSFSSTNSLNTSHLPGYQERQEQRRQRKKATDSEKYSVEERCISRPRSRSLGAILEEIYFSDSDSEDIGRGTLIPRAKLSISSRRSENKEKILTRDIRAVHWGVERKTLEKTNALRPSVSLPFLESDEWFDETMNEVEQNSNCSPISEKFIGHDEIEEYDRFLEISTLQPQNELQAEMSPHDTDHVTHSNSTLPWSKVLKRQMTPTNDGILPPDESEDENSHQKNCDEAVMKIDGEAEKSQAKTNIVIIEPKENFIDITESRTKGPSKVWYSNLKEQFERLDRELGARSAKQTGCRIAGATLKYNGEKSISEESQAHPKKKHYFSQLMRSNKSLIDEELPDPDKVQNIRAMFQENNLRLGGSLQNISSVKVTEIKPERPKSALSARTEDPCPLTNVIKMTKEKEKIVSTNRKDTTDDQRDKYQLRGRPLRWTDSGSMSSGVSSDLSSCDTDLESWGKDVEHPTLSSDDEVDVTEKHYIQAEILDKIRSFGTSVTYFGGKMIRCSVGPLLSPTTQAILEEIGQKTPSGNLATRTFDEFYIKYKEANKKAKVGRTRSFGQGERNVFTDSEIKEHKNELETALGIRCPRGSQAGTQPIKKRIGKSFSSDGRLSNDVQAKPIEIIKKFEEKNKEESVILRTPNTTMFDYEKRISPPKMDMEFEEFEVCESLSEKLQKMEMSNRSSEIEEEEIGSDGCKNEMVSNDTKINTSDLIKDIQKEQPKENEAENNPTTFDREEKENEPPPFNDDITLPENQGKIAKSNDQMYEISGICESNLPNGKPESVSDSDNDASFIEKRNNFEEMVNVRRSSIDNLIKNAKRNSQDKNILQENGTQSEKSLQDHKCCQPIDYNEDIVQRNTRGKRGSKVMLDEYKDKLTEQENNFKVTIKIAPHNEEPYKQAEEQFEEIVIREQDPLDSLELYLPQKFQHDKEKVINDDEGYKRRFHKNGERTTPSKWPIETTVVTDILKNDKSVPKVISKGKSVVKTTKRIF